MGDEDFNIIQRQAAAFVIESFESPDAPVYPYHNLQHTRGVALHAAEIAAHYQLNITDTFIVTTGAWFHDIGHLYGEMQGHEERGAGIMERWMRGRPAGPMAVGDPAELITARIPADLIANIRRCILATKFPSHPQDLPEQIICDADTYHLGTELFRQTDPLVRKEVEMRTGKILPNWTQKTLGFLRQHVFFTTYCRDLLNEKKLQNIAWLEAQIDI